MLQLSETAVLVLDTAKRQYGIPLEYGIRVSGGPTPEGELGVRINFTDGPDDGDVVDEQHGATVFVAAEVVEPLADAELDVSVAVSGNGAAPVTLVLRQDTDGG